jgi:hypothetical protein
MESFNEVPHFVQDGIMPLIAMEGEKCILLELHS